MRRLIGKDDPAELAAEIDALRASAAEASAESERLQAARLVAADYEATLAVDEKIKRAQWIIDSTAAKLPALEAQLKAARAEQHHRAISRHLAALKSLYPRLKAAILGAAALQAEAIKLRDAAIAEIGEAAATVHLPFLQYRGLLLPDLIELWCAELDCVFAPAPQPRVVPESATTTTTALKSKPAKRRRRPARPPDAAVA
jgi:hypothetical protein